MTKIVTQGKGKTQGKHREFYLGWNVATLKITENIRFAEGKVQTEIPSVVVQTWRHKVHWWKT